MTILGLLLIGCSSEEPAKEATNIPIAQITWPTADDQVQQGETIRLIGYVQDALYSSQLNTLRTMWTVDGQDYCAWEEVDAGGNTVCDVEITSFGEIPIRLQVLNPEDALGETTQILTVIENNPADIEILSPLPNQNYYTNIPIDLTAQITDPDQLDAVTQGVWTSSIQGELDVGSYPDANGLFNDSVLLNAGEHTLTFTATEDEIRSSSASVSISIPGPNHPPDCAILTESHELIIAEGGTATLEGTIFDQDIDIFDLSVDISSSIDGLWSDLVVEEDGTFSAIFDQPSVGVQTVSLTVTDEVNTSCTSEIELVVGYGPSVEITEPSDGTWFNQGDLILFQGLVSDANDSPDSLTIHWSSNFDGVFSENSALPNGTVVTYAENLTPGQHVISLWAIDSDGYAVMDDTIININELPEAPSISFGTTTSTSSDDLSVSIDVESFDAENDPITYEYLWHKNGVLTSFTDATIPYTETLRDEQWEVFVRPFDGRGYGDSVSISTTILNSAPIVGSVNLSNLSIFENTVVDCLSLSITDEDGDTVSPIVEWLVNGTVVSTSSSIDGTLFNRDDSIYCQVTPNDGLENGSTVLSSVVTVANTAPTLNEATLDILEITELDTVTCTHPAANDIDSQDIPQLSYNYQWLVNGTDAGITQNSIDGASFDKGDTLQCSVTPTDGTDLGGTVWSSIETIQNATPTIDGATLTPNTAYENSTLTCSPQNAQDPDGDSLSFLYEWLVNGTLISQTTSTLDGASFNVDDAVSCSIIPDDGTDFGISHTSNTVQITNTPPTLTTPVVSPSSNIQTNTALTCSANASDIDDGNLDGQILYTWTASNGATQTGSTWTLNNQIIAPNDTITCSVSVADNNGTAVSQSSSPLSIINTSPTISIVQTSQNSAHTGDTITCAASISDLDDGTLSTNYIWTKGNTTLSTTSQYTVSAQDTDVGDSILCTATGTDANGASVSGTSSSIQILNTSPTIQSVTISPASTLYNDSNLTCTSASSDLDGDPISTSYTWSANQNVLGTGPTLSLAQHGLTPTTQVQCTVSIDDGNQGTATQSAVRTLDNRPPINGSISISTMNPLSSDTVSCTSSASDPDGDSTSISYSWTMNGNVIGNGNSITLTPSTAPVNGTLSCLVTSSDGWTTTTTSSDVTIANTNPSVTTPSISPSTSVVTGTTLYCSATGSDPDDGSLTPTYRWYRNGSEVATGASHTLSAANSNVGQTFYCSATVTDAIGVSASANSSSVTINNTNPTISNVSISPSTSVFNDNTLTCSATANDPDESVSPSYTWSVNGSGLTSSASISLNSYSLNPNDSITCTATTTDSNGGSHSGSTSVTLGNRAPNVTTPILSNTLPEQTETVSCSSSASDPDGESVSVSYSWTMNGNVVGSGSSITLTPSNAPIGGTLTCTASTTDGYGASDSASASGTVNNNPPSISTPSISPSSNVVTGTTLTCSASGSDPEDGSLTPTYRWFRNGSQVGTGSSYTLSAANSDVGQTFYCSASVTDSVGVSASANSSLVTVNNTNPTVTTPTISPNSSMYNNSSLSCSASASDPDQSVAVSYTWRKNGSTIASGASINLVSYSVNPTDSITCVASTSDSNGGTDSKSSSITVGNRAPNVTTPSLSDTTPAPNSSVSCSSTASDPDGESVSVSYTWTMNGSVIGSGSSISLNTSIAPVGATLTCTASTTDGYGGSDSASTSGTITNNPPSISTPSISPSSNVVTGTTLTCSATGSDPEDGNLTPTYRWFRNGSQVGTGSSYTLSAANSNVGQTFYCSATITDSIGSSAAANSASVTVSNSSPTLSSVSISPSSNVVTGTTLSCSASGSDPDDGTLTPTYRWFRNGSQVGTGSSYTLSASNSDVGQTFYCSASVTDAQGSSVNGNSASVTVNNTNPTVTTPTISPNSGVYNNSSLSCSASASDPDQSVSVSYTWQKNGSTIASGASINLISHSVSPTDSIACLASTSDSNGGTDSQSNSVTVGNRAPTVSFVTIDPSNPSEYDIVLCYPAGLDPDGDVISYTYTWTINGQVYSDFQAILLDQGFGMAGSTLTCIVTGEDPYGATDTLSASTTIRGYGGGFNSNSVGAPVLLNQQPSEPTITVTPTQPTTDDDVICEGSSTDPEGTNVQYEYIWTNEDEIILSDILYSDWTNPGDIWTCSVHVFDEDGQSNQSLYTIGIQP